MDPITQRLFEELAYLREELAYLRQTVDSLYLPSPVAGIGQRQPKVFQHHFQNLVLWRNLDVAAELEGPFIWNSDGLDTFGFTMHCAFARIVLSADSLAAQGGVDRLLFTGSLQGQTNSPWCDLDVAQLTSYGQTGEFVFPVLANNELSTKIRFALRAADNHNYGEPNPPNRTISGTVTVTLVQGPSF